MNTSNWIPDLFMKRVMEKGSWTLFSPSDVKDLHDKFGKDFEQAYLGYEAKCASGEMKLFKKIEALDLWRKMLSMLFETGHPWITFKDPCNIRSPQQHVGVVHSSNLCTEITLNTNEFPNGISIVSNSRITFAKEGIYNVAYSIQFKNTDNSSHDIDIWLRKNGTDIANSNSRFGIPARKSAGNPSHLIAVTPIMVDITADGQYVEIMWRVNSTTVSIEHFPAVTADPGVTPAIPATPSVIVGVTHISAQFPPVTRVAPLPVIGFGQIGNVSVSTR
jgi:hypothetical protein